MLLTQTSAIESAPSLYTQAAPSLLTLTTLMSSSGAQSSPSTDFKRSGQDLDHIAAMLRQAIKGERSGDRNSFASEHPYDPERRIPSLGTRFTCFTGTKVQILTQKVIDGDEEDSRVCSTVISFDPERGSGSSGPSHSSSREFDPEAARRDRDSASEKRPAAAVAAVAVTLKLALDFSSIAGAAERAAFEKDLVGDLMSATGESSVSASYFYTSKVPVK